MSRVRVKVVCVLRNAGRVLLTHAVDSHDGRRFLLPPGGGVEFRERLDDAIRRELLEELNVAIPSPKRVGLVESLFHYSGVEEHELVFVYEAECDDPTIVALDEVPVLESDGQILEARWYTPEEARGTGLPIFPEGLLELLSDPTSK